MRTRFLLGGLAALCLAGLSSAQAPLGPRGALSTRVSPLIPLESFSQHGLRLATDAALVRDLDGLSDLRLKGVTVPSPSGFATVDLELSRVDPVSDDAWLRVDGEVVAGAAALRQDVSLWTGVVAGEQGSDVYLAFTPTGTRGWIARADGRSHFFAVPDDSGNWGNSSTLLVHQDDTFVQENTPSWTCETDTSNLPVLAEDPDQGPAGQVRRIGGYTPAARQNSSAGSGSIECRIVVETDYRYYQLFNDLTAATNYAVSLWGAISCRFVDAVDVFITVPQLSIYTTSNDPWNTPDVGGSSSQMLNEFQRYWKPDGFPQGAALAHFMSGANLGGGVAYVASFCSESGVAVSGNLAGQTPMPVPTKSSLNWDFVVCAHETGHNFGSPHTHDYCPPVDSCYPGLCTSGTQCISNGTIMGYCHLCPGGLSNVQTFFHQRVANRMSKVVSVSCICGACPCAPPVVNGIAPTSVVAYDPDGQEVTLTGKRFSNVNQVIVDGLPLGPGEFTVDSYTQMRFTMPRVSSTGMVSVSVEDGCGPSVAALIAVQTPAEAQLGIDYPVENLPIVSTAQGMPVVVAADPGDLAFVLWSPENLPTVLPGYLSLEIGNNFGSLYDLWTVQVPAKAWEEMVFPVAALPLGSTLYLQAAVLNGPGNFPLESSQTATAVVWF